MFFLFSLLPLLPPFLLTLFIPLFAFIYFLSCFCHVSCLPSLLCFICAYSYLLDVLVHFSSSLLFCFPLFFLRFLLPLLFLPFSLLIHVLASLRYAFSVLIYSLPSLLSPLFTFLPYIHLSFLHLPLFLYSCIYINAWQQLIASKIKVCDYIIYVCYFIYMFIYKI